MKFLDFFNDQTLNTILGMSFIVIISVLMIIYPINKKEHYKKLLIGYGISSIAVALLSFQGSLPIIVTVIVANTSLLIGEFYIIQGFLEMGNRIIELKFFIVLIVLFSTTHIYFTYFSPSVNCRIINFSICMIFAMVLFIIKFTPIVLERRNIPFAMIWFTYIILISNNLIRMINAFGSENIPQLFRGANILKAYLLSSIFVNMVRIISILITNTKDLIDE